MLLCADGIMFFRLSISVGFLLISLLSQCSTVRRLDTELDRGQYIRIDSLSLPLPLSLNSGDTNRDGFPDLLAGSAIYLNPGGNLAEPWKRINVGIDARSLVLANINNDGNPDLLALMPPDLYWLEALDPEGIQWTSTKVATLPFSISGDVKDLYYDAARKSWTLAGKDSLYLIQVPENPEERRWKITAEPLDSSSNLQGVAMYLEVDLDGDGDKDAIRLEDHNIYILHNDLTSGKTRKR